MALINPAVFLLTCEFRAEPLQNNGVAKLSENGAVYIIGSSLLPMILVLIYGRCLW